MKYLSFLSVLLLACCSCSYKANEYALQQADSLMIAAPDSAYRLIKSIEPKSLWGDEQHAKYALLYTQAQYKNYDPIESDSLINIAVDYYQSSDDKDKYTLSLIYKGAALGDMGLRREAIEWYKKAESAADSVDYMTLGLVNTRIAELYAESFIDSQKDIERFKKALQCYQKANHKQYENYILGRIGQRYRVSNIDSAYKYINQSIELAKERGDSTQLYYYTSSLVGAYYLDKKYDKVSSVFHTYPGQLNNINNLLIDAYANTGKIDSAEMLLKNLPLSSPTERAQYLIAQEKIAVAKEDYRMAYDYSVKATDLVDSIKKVAREDDLYTVEKRFDNRVANEKVQKLETKNKFQTLIISLSLTIIIALVITTLLIIKNRRISLSQQATLIEQLNTDLEYQKLKGTEKSNTKAVSRIPDLKLKSLIEERNLMIKNILNIIHLHGSNTQRFNKVFNNFISQHKHSQDACSSVIDIANALHHNVIDFVKTQYPNLTNTDLLLLSLTCLEFSIGEICVYMNYSDVRNVSSSRSRIMKEKIKVNSSMDCFLKEAENNCSKTQINTM